MKQVYKDIVWCGILQVTLLLGALVVLAMDMKWRKNLSEASVILRKGDLTLSTLSQKMEDSRELEECKDYGRFLAEFASSATISLKADNISNHRFIKSTEAMLWLVMGSGLLSILLLARTAIILKAAGLAKQA